MPAAGMPPPSDRIMRMHIENVAIYHKSVQITPEWYDEAARRRPASARRVQTTNGWNYKTVDAQMRTAGILVFIGLDFNDINFRERAPSFRWVQMTSAGVEHIMLSDWLPKRVVITARRRISIATCPTRSSSLLKTLAVISLADRSSTGSTGLSNTEAPRKCCSGDRGQNNKAQLKRRYR